MAIRKAKAVWEGKLRDGKGTFAGGSGKFSGTYDFGSRFGESAGTNPEELVGAAHAGCFSMALAGGLERAGFPPTHIETSADVTVEKLEVGFRITSIVLTCRAQVAGIDAATFATVAEATKTGCPVSAALAAVPVITLDAQLTS